MKKTEKSFDCVEMKRAGALRVYEETKDLTAEQEREYWQRKNEEMRKRFPRMRWPKDSDSSER
jgi:hypothetical protein